MPEIAIVVGNPNPNSRTREAAEHLAERIATLSGLPIAPTIDLIDHADGLFQWQSPALDELTARVAASRLAIFASPTYKASYTGLLKAFLDRYPTHGLAGVTAVPLFTMGSPHHTLAVEFTLRPLLVELAASTPTSGLSLDTSDYDQWDAALDAWVDRHRDVLTAVLGAPAAG